MINTFTMVYQVGHPITNQDHPKATKKIQRSVASWHLKGKPIADSWQQRHVDRCLKMLPTSEFQKLSLDQQRIRNQQNLEQEQGQPEWKARIPKDQCWEIELGGMMSVFHPIPIHSETNQYKQEQRPQQQCWQEKNTPIYSTNIPTHFNKLECHAWEQGFLCTMPYRAWPDPVRDIGSGFRDQNSYKRSSILEFPDVSTKRLLMCCDCENEASHTK